MSEKFVYLLYFIFACRSVRRVTVRDNVRDLRVRAPGDPQARVPVVLARALAARGAVRALPRARARPPNRRATLLDLLPRTRHHLHPR